MTDISALLGDVLVAHVRAAQDWPVTAGEEGHGGGLMVSAAAMMTAAEEIAEREIALGLFLREEAEGADRPAPISAIRNAAGTLTFTEALAASEDAGRWVPACGGTEEPFHTRTGYRLLYCWHTTANKHAYLNLDTDIILGDEEALSALATY